jgi:hypothetical protein
LYHAGLIGGDIMATGKADTFHHPAASWQCMPLSHFLRMRPENLDRLIVSLSG